MLNNKFELECELCLGYVHKRYKYYCLLCRHEICSICCILVSLLTNNDINTGICQRCVEIYDKGKIQYKNIYLKKLNKCINNNISNIIYSYVVDVES